MGLASVPYNMHPLPEKGLPMVCIPTSGTFWQQNHASKPGKPNSTTPEYSASHTYHNHAINTSGDTHPRNAKTDPNPPVTPSLHQQLLIPPNRWAEPLWHDIRPHAHINTLHAQIPSTTRILIVSNATVHTDGRGTCAWTIWSNTELWSGEGYVPSPLTNMMYSRLAEAYSLYTALSCFQQYCQYYPELLWNPHTVHAYCNNQGVIDWASQTAPYLYPHDAISNDYPIYAELKHTINSLQPITVILHHIKGH